MTRWGVLCPQCDHIKKREHGPGRYPRPDRCPECNWPMNVVDLDIVDGEPDDNQEIVTDGGRDAGHDGEIDHPIMLGKRWGDRAESNIEKWGNQRHDTLLLALIEEIGEVAMAMEANSETIYDATPPDADDVPSAVGRKLISDMADLGRETRDFLEGEYGDPAGDGDSPDEHRIHGEPTDVTQILEEVEDTAPLCWQLYWALQEVPDGAE